MTRIRPGLDHLVVAVEDLSAATERFTDLGFTGTPAGRHPTLGTANTLFVFGDTYVELLAAEASFGNGSRVQEFLQRGGEGLMMLALRADDLNDEAVSYQENGLAFGEPLTFERPVDVPGLSGTARFTILQLTLDLGADVGTFLCQHHTPDLVWHPPWRSHPNGASEVSGIEIRSGHLEPSKRELQKLGCPDWLRIAPGAPPHVVEIAAAGPPWSAHACGIELRFAG